ncbi:LIM homeobox transcription factor 1-beta isoform X1 [Parasteatoda tepidariorum]|uniref:LIM homeobox transcription factor 1-beta isoform X1 n=1 Tax=Parasteatoda tepidariorum TaxID=114398 RepID=UPI0039BD053E
MDSPEKLNGFLTTNNGGAGTIRGGKMKKELCTACQQPIIDRYIMRVMDNYWHEGCLTCSVCHIHLSHTCYSRDRKLYCKADYDKLFAVKCTGCVLPIAPTELVMRALDHVYHLPCFVCVGCGRQLQKGDQFVVRSGRLYCRPDFEKEMAVMQIVTRGENGQLTPTGPHNGQPRQDGRRGPKRPRTILTTAQRRAFKASFEISQKPCRKVRESLAKETGLSVRIVQVWFQNQRAKLKKLQRKQQQQLQQQSQKQNTDSQNGGSNPDLSSPGKDGKKSDELSHGDPSEYSPPYAHLSVGDSDPSQFPLGALPYTTEGQYYSSSHPDTQYMKSDISMDSEGSLGGLEDVLISQGQTATMGDGGHIFPSSVNPIDKLYSMQTSYFSSSECECLGATN